MIYSPSPLVKSKALVKSTKALLSVFLDLAQWKCLVRSCCGGKHTTVHCEASPQELGCDTVLSFQGPFQQYSKFKIPLVTISFYTFDSVQSRILDVPHFFRKPNFILVLTKNVVKYWNKVITALGQLAYNCWWVWIKRNALKNVPPIRPVADSCPLIKVLPENLRGQAFPVTNQ